MTELELKTSDDRIVSLQDLWFALAALIEADPDARKHLAALIEPRPALIPHFAWEREDEKSYLKIIGWIDWPADKPLPTGFLGKNGIIPDPDAAERFVDENAAGFI